ncbi:phage terminase small subunit P27 family [Sphingomonas montanisoli]|uniref:Phage terminase small subunit P27 family n=1 Tax=Sphingomonas montanisoli TaxID=2606412 RepID=A0A5D9C4S3_9SPHN|nr:phage terminase small subunit P27 family [Sphingomonas montanisoli]TZG26496.1 phage terminase small subunit P27 family [Sphingomonas montanisoli]
MTRGRRPQPEAVREAKGNTSRRPRLAPVATVEPTSSGSRLPGWLDTQKRIRKVAAERASKLTGEIWAFLQPELSRMNLVKATDEVTLGRFCRYMAEWIEYTHVLDQEGTFYITSSPHVGELRRPHPAFKQRKDIEQHLKDLGDVLGLSPAARQRLMLQLANSNGLQPNHPGAPANSEGGDQLQMPSVQKSPVGLLGGTRLLN